MFKLVKDLSDGEYFQPLHCTTSFLYESGRYTRLWDGVYVDSFFNKPYEKTRVKVLDRETAVKLAKEYRSL